MHEELTDRERSRANVRVVLVDKQPDLASSKQLPLSPTLHLSSKFHRQPGREGLGPESALFPQS